jgi:fatty acid desaturase
MNFPAPQLLIPQADYTKKLRPLMPPEAFLPDLSKLWILLINLAILILGWGIADYLDWGSLLFVFLYLPFALVMGNSVVVLLFSSHDLLHGSVIKNARVMQLISLLGLTMLWMPPTLWKKLHNQVHHSKTNSVDDPDRSYLYEQPKNWGKWIQNRFTPSIEVNPFEFVLGMGMSWGVYTFRNLTSVLFFNRESVSYVPASFKMKQKARWTIVGEVLLISLIHLSIMAYLNFHPLKLVLAYFLPIGLGYAGVIFYIYTNHMLCPMTEINDPIINSTSLRVPRIFDLLHFNFSYHAEHHIFPGINSNYYPLVQELVQAHYPDRANYVLPAGEAWRLLLTTPRYYKDPYTLMDWAGNRSVEIPSPTIAVNIDPKPVI